MPAGRPRLPSTKAKAAVTGYAALTDSLRITGAPQNPRRPLPSISTSTGGAGAAAGASATPKGKGKGKGKGKARQRDQNATSDSSQSSDSASDNDEDREHGAAAAAHMDSQATDAGTHSPSSSSRHMAKSGSSPSTPTLKNKARIARLLEAAAIVSPAENNRFVDLDQVSASQTASQRRTTASQRMLDRTLASRAAAAAAADNDADTDGGDEEQRETQDDDQDAYSETDESESEFEWSQLDADMPPANEATDQDNPALLRPLRKTWPNVLDFQSPECDETLRAELVALAHHCWRHRPAELRRSSKFSSNAATAGEASTLLGSIGENDMPDLLCNLVVERTIVFLDSLIREVRNFGKFKHRQTDKRRGADAVSVFSAASLCTLDAEALRRARGRLTSSGLVTTEQLTRRKKEYRWRRRKRARRDEENGSTSEASSSSS
ncbi:hypothetical protein CAOG_004048 [Capsaspora owczarzaki ATCC 30864]|uniref:Uncharacterized protein n=1 Tax=Capsaspora owczarzaki (strain ATCC 30864) TaxID=595528 RepID=A0A0D2WPE8_CAPO3|nr:hypothetical protein CAOG_004048 [Capsaspora owczarzaki ATCC 30864]